MSFSIVFVDPAGVIYSELEKSALKTHENRRKKKLSKISKVEGLFKQVHKTISLLSQNPRHPSLKTHQFSSILNPYNPSQKVFEAYVQNNTPGAYRVFWCYGPGKNEITIIAITPHP